MDLFNLFASISLDTSEYDSGIDSASSAAESLQDSLYDIGTATNDASSNLGNAADAADDTGDSLNDLSEDSDNSNNSFSGFSDIVDKFVTAGIATAAIKAIQEIGSALYDLALDAESSTAVIAQGTGATGEDLEALSTSAQTAFKNVSLASQTSLSDVSNTLAEINTRFGSTGEELEDLTVTITDFASVTGQDGASAVDSLANVMSLWGLDMEDLPDLMDDITTASQGCQASASELESALATNAGAFQSLGYSTEDALAFLTMYSDNGGDVSEATRIMRTAITNLSDATNDVPGAFEAAIEAIANCETTAEALQAQVGDTGLTVEDVFGSTNAQKIAQNIQSGTSTMEEWTAALVDNQGAMQQTVEDSTTMSDSISSSMNRIKTDIQTLFSPGIEAIVTGAANGLDAVVEFAETAPVKITNFVSTAQEKFENFKTNTTDKFNTVKNNITDWGNNLVSTGNEKLTSFVGTAAEKFENFRSNAAENLSSNIATVSSWGASLISMGESSFSSFVSNASSKLSSFNSTASSMFSSVNSITNTWAANTVSQAQTAMSNFVSAISNKVSSATSAASNIVNSIKDTFNGLVSSAASWGSDMVQNFVDGITSKIQAAANAVSSVASTISSYLHFSVPDVGPLSDADTYMPDFMKLLAEGINDGTSDVVGEAENLAGSLSSAINDGDYSIGVSGSASGSYDSYSGSTSTAAYLLEWLEDGGLRDVLTDVLVNNVQFDMDGREVGRLVRKYA